MIEPPDVEGFEDLVEVERSGHAVVFRAWQPRFQRQVSIEVFLDVSVERFDAERKAMGALAGHPNTVAVHHAGVTDDGLPFVVTEFRGEESLADLVARQGPLPWDQVAKIVIKLAGVVESARRAGSDVVIDPRRVRLSRFGEPLVTAFGSEPGEGLSSLMATLALLAGSPSPPVPGPVKSPLDLVTALQQVQRERRQPVIEMPVALDVEPPGPPAPPDAVTVVPRPARRGLRRAPIALAVVTVVLLAAVTTAALRESDEPGEVAGSTAPEPGTPVDPPLYSDGFTPDRGWQEAREGSVVRRTFEDGQYRVSVVGQESDRQPAAWKAQPPERRVSVSLDAVFLSAELTRVGVACEASPGGALAFLGNDGRWVIQKYEGGPLVSGRPVSPAPETGRPFRLELDCDAGRTPGHLTLWLDGRPLGEVDAAVTSVSTVGYAVDSRSTRGTEVGLRKLEVRRLR